MCRVTIKKPQAASLQEGLAQQQHQQQQQQRQFLPLSELSHFDLGSSPFLFEKHTPVSSSSSSAATSEYSPYELGDDGYFGRELEGMEPQDFDFGLSADPFVPHLSPEPTSNGPSPVPHSPDLSPDLSPLSTEGLGSQPFGWQPYHFGTAAAAAAAPSPSLLVQEVDLFAAKQASPSPSCTLVHSSRLPIKVATKRKTLCNPMISDDKREKNRLAAEKYRRKGKELIQSLEEKCAELSANNTYLRQRNQHLDSEIAYLRGLLQASGVLQGLQQCRDK